MVISTDYKKCGLHREEHEHTMRQDKQDNPHLGGRCMHLMSGGRIIRSRSQAGLIQQRSQVPRTRKLTSSGLYHETGRLRESDSIVRSQFSSVVSSCLQTTHVVRCCLGGVNVSSYAQFTRLVPFTIHFDALLEKISKEYGDDNLNKFTSDTLFKRMFIHKRTSNEG